MPMWSTFIDEKGYPKVGDVVTAESGELGIANRGRVMVAEYDADCSHTRTFVWRECSSEYPREIGGTKLRLEKITPWVEI